MSDGTYSGLVVDKALDAVRSEVESHRNSGVSMLPRQEDIASRYGVSMRAIRDAFGKLRRDNLIKPVRGKGTFIVPLPKRTGQVLVVSNRMHHPYSTMGSNVINKILQEEGFAPKIVEVKNPQDEFERLVMTEHPVGVMLICPPTTEYVRAILQKTSTPVVSIGDTSDPIRFPAVCDSVAPNNRALAYAAVERLIAQGHRNIAFVTWGPKTVYREEYLLGLRESLEKHGLPFHEEWCVEFPTVDFSQPNSEALFHQSIGELQTHVDRWFEPDRPGGVPTGLIHFSVAEIQIRDMVHYYFHDRFKLENIVAMVPEEFLPTNYNGMGPAYAICFSFENLARRALEFLLRPQNETTTPIREIREEIFACERNHGIWSRDRK